MLVEQTSGLAVLAIRDMSLQLKWGESRGEGLDNAERRRQDKSWKIVMASARFAVLVSQTSNALEDTIGTILYTFRGEVVSMH